jgi:hypothetical protein
MKEGEKEVVVVVLGDGMWKKLNKEKYGRRKKDCNRT